VQAALGVCLELEGAALGVRACTPHFPRSAAVGSLGGTTSVVVVMHVADDGGEVAVAEADLTAARVTTEPALGVVEIFER
jgi:hypothetical protein